MVDRVLTLNGVRINRTDAAWEGLLDGSVGVSLLREAGHVATFRISFPTAFSDINDFIWREEIELGFTTRWSCGRQDPSSVRR